MKDLANRINIIVKEFIEKYVPEETTHEFILACIHFNTNLNACSKYDLMRINHKAKELVNIESNELLTKSAIFSYILFNGLNKSKIEPQYIGEVKIAIINISTIITDYMTFRIDEKELNLKLYDELKQLGL